MNKCSIISHHTDNMETKKPILNKWLPALLHVQPVVCDYNAFKTNHSRSTMLFQQSVPHPAEAQLCWLRLQVNHRSMLFPSAPVFAVISINALIIAETIADEEKAVICLISRWHCVLYHASWLHGNCMRNCIVHSIQEVNKWLNSITYPYFVWNLNSIFDCKLFISIFKTES